MKELKLRVKNEVRNVLEAVAKNPFNINKTLHQYAKDNNKSFRTCKAMYYHDIYAKYRESVIPELVQEKKVFFIKGINTPEFLFEKNIRWY